ncbi:hypothetical protein Pmani_028964 [Petrolisthes manimaculis]|uniref:Uncharacterized protein n=1 Tax=Petrolisthes manimaculis TaxID=1843537 RepID=A0AAE1P086_9EUCA|nr:hypothetical protein Pmani_028964 [Petrolisthes manimaculis]
MIMMKVDYYVEVAANKTLQVRRKQTDDTTGWHRGSLQESTGGKMGRDRRTCQARVRQSDGGWVSRTEQGR